MNMQPEIDRRTFALIALGGLLAACGESGSSLSADGESADGESRGTTVDSTTTSPEPPSGPSAVLMAERETGADAALAARSVSSLGYDLFAAIVGGSEPGANVTISPASIAIALAMVEPGTVAGAQEQMRALLSIDDPAAFHASMNGLEQSLESRAPFSGGDGDAGEVTIRVGNAAFLQPGYPLEQPYLDTVGRFYGPVVNELDFRSDPDAAVDAINTFVADATEERITDPLTYGDITDDVVLALVNTLFLTASWFSPFAENQTSTAPFTTNSGESVDVDMMSGSSEESIAGDGWVGASKFHVGGLTSQFVLPDPNRFDDVGTRLPDVFDELTNSAGPGGEFRMPRFETRVDSPLNEPLKALGLTDVFFPGSLLATADDPQLFVSKIAHSTFVAYDEEGVEAAATTIVLENAESEPIAPPVAVVLDRPFFYRIVDRQSSATLFLGRVMNPKA